MNKKGKIITLIVLLAIAIILTIIVFAQEFYPKSSYLTVIDNYASVSSAYTHYKVCNPTDVNYQIDSANKFKADFIEQKNTLTSYKFKILKDSPYEQEIYKDVLVPKTCYRTNNLTQQEEPYNCSFYRKELSHWPKVG